MTEVEDQPTESTAGKLYWEKRRNLVYYQVVRILVDALGSNATTMLDVGSGNCPYLEWFPHIPQRFSLDRNHPYASAGIEPVKTDFLQWSPGKRFDLVTCLQVLEHVPDAESFARKLLEVSEILLVTVPYKWPFGQTKSHVHDPVDETKLLSWFGREPNYSYICREVTGEVYRLVQVYDRFPERWKSLKQRQSIIDRQMEAKRIATGATDQEPS